MLRRRSRSCQSECRLHSDRADRTQGLLTARVPLCYGEATLRNCPIYPPSFTDSILNSSSRTLDQGKPVSPVLSWIDGTEFSNVEVVPT
jgi:hypothetical protein